MPLAGRRALVTGTSRGIGRAVALRFEELGARIGSLQRGSGVGFAVPLDLAQPETVDAAVMQVVAELGGIDICVYASGVNHREPALDVSLDDWQRVITVNLTSAFVVTRAAARQMSEQGNGGAIVHLASELAVFGGLGVAPYSASKGGVVQLMKSQSNEWAVDGIRVNAITPGWIETDMTAPLRDDPRRHSEISGRIPMGRWGSPADVASAAAWLVSSEAHYVTGAVITVDGGYQAR